MSRILVIRGGAIGDFILTLPAIGLLREAFPSASINLLGYQHIVALAHGRYYADATRSIEYGGLASFFVPGGKLPQDLVDYFGSFAQVISYLYDPDGFFEANLRRAGVKHLLCGDPRLHGEAHASAQLARPLEQLALYLEADAAARLYPHAGDRQAAASFLEGTGRPLVALHPGSGGRHKLWPLAAWQELIDHLSALPAKPTLLLVGGEADGEALSLLKAPPGSSPLRLAQHLPLPELAAVLEQADLFLGHDSGISHLAAGVGTESLLLFGQTDPAVWAPRGAHVHVLTAPEGDLTRLSCATVLAELLRWMSRDG